MEKDKEAEEQTNRILHILKLKNKIKFLNLNPQTAENAYWLIYKDYHHLKTEVIFHNNDLYCLNDYFPIKGWKKEKKMISDTKLLWCWVTIRFLNSFSVLNDNEIRDVIKYYYDILTFLGY